MQSEMSGKIVVALVLSLLSTIGLAQQSGTLDVVTTVQKELVETNADGETIVSLVPADTVVPGERVIYTTTFRNTGNDAADNVVITNPLSENLIYVDSSADGVDMQLTFSVDGGESFADADQLTILDQGEERPATASDYTHLRWTLGSALPPGAEGIVRFTAALE